MELNGSLEKAINIIKSIAEPDKIILFGSRAADNYNKDSDYDLLILKKGLKSIKDLTKKIYLNLNNIGAPVDIIIADTKKYDSLKNNPYKIYFDINKSGKVIYEK